ncbi:MULTISPECIES: hypothetical protein [unclassified Janthinobacterium]|uniref:hypothetical protein n=1 Tax=unclassified Janthinobacterium TaxID=2610881 RepID=UPI00160BF070|nr:MULTISPECIES: hypothetical protein [unclassified Janthinobacterium]MBB5606384.1 hypothetical protein [Janthinobacterium sp. S3T4]MBB5611744.1 hypothetical protein [Janthinobacterium sp. S3M3]
MKTGKDTAEWKVLYHGEIYLRQFFKTPKFMPIRDITTLWRMKEVIPDDTYFLPCSHCRRYDIGGSGTRYSGNFSS